MQSRSKLLVMICILVLGIVLRIGVAFHGSNYDMQSYWIVGQIVDRGGNVYASTERYNYGPVWFTILGGLYKLTAGAADHFLAYRLSIAAFLTLVDVGIALLSWHKFGKKAAALFFLNPISIMITGFHSQFDNLAILLGFVSVILLSGKDVKRNIGGWLMLGISLMTKHILFAFPLWLALRERSWRKVAAVLIPLGVFFAGFMPFWYGDSMAGIIEHVFLYRSMNNAPFWTTVAPQILVNNLPILLLFIGSLSLVGLVVRKQKLINSFLIYLGCLVLLSSSIANQYLAILVPFIAVYWNIWLALLTFVASLFLLIEPNAGLGISQLSFIPLKAVSLNIQNILLFLGLVWVPQVKQAAMKFSQQVSAEVKYQLDSFWKD